MTFSRKISRHSFSYKARSNASQMMECWFLDLLRHSTDSFPANLGAFHYGQTGILKLSKYTLTNCCSGHAEVIIRVNKTCFFLCCGGGGGAHLRHFGYFMVKEFFFSEWTFKTTKQFCIIRAWLHCDHHCITIGIIIRFGGTSMSLF